EQELDWAGVALAKALAHPPTAAEWCLPLVREGGAVVLWVGPSADRDHVGRVAERIAGAVEPAPEGFLLIRKLGRTPAGFPRRAARVACEGDQVGQPLPRSLAAGAGRRRRRALPARGRRPVPRRRAAAGGGLRLRSARLPALARPADGERACRRRPRGRAGAD